MENSIEIDRVVSEGKFIKNLNKDGKKFNSQADLYLWKKKFYVIRIIGKQYIIGSDKQLARLEKSLHIYYYFLNKYLRLKLPEIFISSLDEKKGIIRLMTEYFPKGSIANSGLKTQRIRQFKMVAKALIKLISSGKNICLKNRLICSIDTNPDNFFLSKKNAIVYNDFTPPLYREKNGIWFEFRRKDEIHVSKTEKEKRYFNGVNLLLNFVNKVRIYLPFEDYLKFIKWLCTAINDTKFSADDLDIFIKIIREFNKAPIVNSYKFKKYSSVRDLLRFSLSLNDKLDESQLKEIYKRSKKPDGLFYLKNKVKNLMSY
jgi:hypothetical protein